MAGMWKRRRGQVVYTPAQVGACPRRPPTATCPAAQARPPAPMDAPPCARCPATSSQPPCMDGAVGIIRTPGRAWSSWPPPSPMCLPPPADAAMQGVGTHGGLNPVAIIYPIAQHPSAFATSAETHVPAAARRCCTSCRSCGSRPCCATAACGCRWTRPRPSCSTTAAPASWTAARARRPRCPARSAACTRRHSPSSCPPSGRWVRPPGAVEANLGALGA
jgi:hypothetical protein